MRPDNLGRRLQPHPLTGLVSYVRLRELGYLTSGPGVLGDFVEYHCECLYAFLPLQRNAVVFRVALGLLKVSTYKQSSPVGYIVHLQ